jgi:hypothetical protein
VFLSSTLFTSHSFSSADLCSFAVSEEFVSFGVILHHPPPPHVLCLLSTDFHVALYVASSVTSANDGVHPANT